MAGFSFSHSSGSVAVEVLEFEEEYPDEELLEVPGKGGVGQPLLAPLSPTVLVRGTAARSGTRLLPERENKNDCNKHSWVVKKEVEDGKAVLVDEHAGKVTIKDVDHYEYLGCVVSAD